MFAGGNKREISPKWVNKQVNQKESTIVIRHEI